MVNIEDFIKRLEIILDYYSLNASSFADKIGVQRSSLSHLLSGRNKPSLDFVLKILEVFPEIDLYWILNGKGSFPKNTAELQTAVKATEPLNEKNSTTLFNKPISAQDLFSENQIPDPVLISGSKKIENQNFNKQNDSEEIDKIVVFYKNGTFKSYRPN
ncbi:helix-turn-helix transcriptional regulator [Flavobacterium sp. GP15]|uniref:helix-turn-helix domain-containing protein n=1 Tax=Flavobacterium sp. GP15 TaxID=2758567 RepID=UPI00165E59A2|nr:helix-turn-helix transcriptional regulator [Flavobacterium sp. GP15]